MEWHTQCRTLLVMGQTVISLVRVPLIVMAHAETPLDPREERIPLVQVTERPNPEGIATTPPDRGLERTTADPPVPTTESATDTTATRAPQRIDPTDMLDTHTSITMVMTGDGNWDIGSGGIGYLDIGLL